MKGPFPGQVLTAVGLDANNGIYPVAYSIVEAENKSSWTWFLKYLGDDLDIDSNSYFTFISDRQKGLLPALSDVFPNAEHRYFLRHIQENMKVKWRGNLFKDMLWKCASATTIPQFNKLMEEVRKADPSLHEWLKDIPANSWSRSHFSGRTKTDVLLNNICENLNKQLVGGRDKPIITCLEFIRE
ncbi:protein FAR1-RELATED SEQUENCE 6-like [Bidens hawaiensis]|uniref:protein FAR1-RELATED SEQUENCE 6-like n=1 Tax=Bidens hawaiensis TaxID=980011 RepID=UPI00404A7E6F